MKHIFSSLIIAAALGSVVSCNMDLYPDTTLPYDKDVPMIQTPEDITSYHRGIYSNFRACQAGTYKIADDVMFDGFNAAQEFGNRYGGIHRLDASFTSGDDYVTSFWSDMYTSIKNYNIIIEQIPIATVDAESYKDKLETMMADAKVARAWTYLQLARKFGKAYNAATAGTDLCVPLVTVYDQNARPARTSVQAVYNQIKQDLDDAYEVLQNVAGQNSSQEFTADAVNCIYANYYLDVKNYDLAYSYADKVISNAQYSLCATEDEFKAEFFEDAGKEAIMLLPASLTELTGGYGEYINYGSDANSPTGYAFGSGFLPSQVLVDSYESADLRRRNWFDNTSKIPFESNGSYYQNKFYVFVKFKGNTALNSSGIIDGHIRPKPFSLPEMYLVAAEAAFLGNHKVNALAKLSALQTKRGATPVSTITLEAIQKEWFKETVGEGLRLECLKRWNIGCGVRTGQTGALESNVLMETSGYTDRSLAAGDYHLCWPIPSYEMKVNSNLVQNEGYSSVDVD